MPDLLFGEAMEVTKKIGEVPLGVGEHEVLMRRNERDRAYEDAELFGAHGKAVEVELKDGRGRAERGGDGVACGE